MFQGLGGDLRYTLRALARSPGFTLVAVLSLSLGIGANTAMFGVVKTLILTPLPVEAPEELTILAWARGGELSTSQSGSTSYRDPESGTTYRSNFSYEIYRALREATPDDVDLFAFAFPRRASVAMGDRPAHLAGAALADGRYFATLRPEMELGRPIGEPDDQPDAPLVAVLSHSFWMRAFGGDRDVIGRTVRVNGTVSEVVGVTGEGFHGLSMGGFFPRTEITLPLASQPRVYSRMASGGALFTDERQFWLRVMARIPDGTSASAVEQALGAVMIEVPSPLVLGDGYVPELRLLPGRNGAQPVRADAAQLLYFLLGVVAVVLLIACVNLASLMLARGVKRQHETAVRRALGSGHARLVRQALLESALLAGGGTATGLALMVWSREILSGLLTGSLGSGALGSTEMSVSLDPVVFAVSATLGIVATVAFGLLPALRWSGVDAIGSLKHRGPGGSVIPRLTLGRILIALQIGASVPLVVGALLFLETLAQLGRVELGFDPKGLATFQVDPANAGLPSGQQARLYEELLARVSEVPGVRSVTLMENVLLSGVTSNNRVTVDGREHLLYRNAVGPAFLETMGMRLLAGRGPGLEDGPDAPYVGAINEAATREIFGGASPVGRIVRFAGRDVQIVGVVNDAPYRNQREPVPPTLYPSALQWDGYGGHHVVVRTDVPLAQLEPALRQAVARVAPDLPVEMRSQTTVMAQASAKERIFTQLLSTFGGFALLLASIGLHGVTSYSVTRRTREIGVRVAVGARPGQVLWLVMRQVLLLAIIGLAVGVPLSLAFAPAVASLLFGVAPNDVLTIVGASASLLGVAMAAGLAPATRAARLDVRATLGAE